MFFAPSLFELIFGAEWRVAGVYAQIISPAMAIRFVASPLSIVFSALNRQELSTIWKVIAVVTTPVFLFTSLSFDSPLYSIIFLSINDILLYLLYLIMIFKVSGVCVKDLLRGLF
jgi:O-antigen/teichoic acid export membrane protein